MKAIIKQQAETELAIANERMRQAGLAADQAAAQSVFSDYTSKKSPHTIVRAGNGIQIFEQYLHEAGVPAANLIDSPLAWREVTWGIVEGFKRWMLREGFSISTINARLSTVRTFAMLAMKANPDKLEHLQLIQAVKGYSRQEARHVDEQRAGSGVPTRRGFKKAQPVSIPDDAAETMKHQPHNPKGRRDALLMCLLIDHGLRVGEVASLQTKDFDLRAGKLTFYRSKVDKTQTHTLSLDTRRAASAYIKHDAPETGAIWRASRKGSPELRNQLNPKTATRLLTKRVELLGRKVGIIGLSAHDCRHYWATYEANKGTPIDKLKEAGGWNSIAMPVNYIEASKIANEGTARIKKEG